MCFIFQFPSIPYSFIKTLQNHPKKSLMLHLWIAPLPIVFHRFFHGKCPPGPRHRTSHWAPHCARHRGRPGCGRSGGHAPAPLERRNDGKMRNTNRGCHQQNHDFDMVWYVFLICFLLFNVDSLANMVGWTGQTYYINMSQNGDYIHEVSIYQTCSDWPAKNRCFLAWTKWRLIQEQWCLFAISDW